MHGSIYIHHPFSQILHSFPQGVAIWINGTQPVTTWAGFRTPRNTFPFARLARTILVDGSWSFLYHQMNSTTIAEEQRDEPLKDWVFIEYINYIGFLVFQGFLSHTGFDIAHICLCPRHLIRQLIN